jgi:hypothetical protein
MLRSRWSLVIGLGIPVIAIVVVPPFIANTQVTVFGIPLLFFWMFAWFPLTSVCLGVSWFGFDRSHYLSQDRAQS